MPTPNVTKLEVLRQTVGDEAVNTLLAQLKANHGEAVAAGIVEKAKKPMMDEAEMMDEETAEPEAKKKKGGFPFAKKDDEEVDEQEEFELDSDTVDELALIAETVAETVGPAFDAIAERLDNFESAAKEFANFVEVKTKEAKELVTLKEEVATLTKQLAELRGDQPRAAAKGYRASTSAETITVLQKEGPQPDAFLASFVSDFVMKANLPGQAQ